MRKYVDSPDPTNDVTPKSAATEQPSETWLTYLVKDILKSKKNDEE